MRYLDYIFTRIFEVFFFFSCGKFMCNNVVRYFFFSLIFFLRNYWERIFDTVGLAAYQEDLHYYFFLFPLSVLLLKPKKKNHSKSLRIILFDFVWLSCFGLFFFSNPRLWFFLFFYTYKYFLFFYRCERAQMVKLCDIPVRIDQSWDCSIFLLYLLFKINNKTWMGWSSYYYKKKYMRSINLGKSREICCWDGWVGFSN